MEVRWIYMIQLGIWFCTALSHRIFEARHKDYFVMYTHHAVTIFLVTSSWGAGYFGVGLLVLMIHDLSDVPLDMLKSTNYLGLDEKSGTYIVELSFVSTAVAWAYGRLWVFPRYIIRSIFPSYCDYSDVTTACGKHPNVTVTCVIGLCSLFAMHCYWYTLIINIAVRLIRGDDSHKVAADVYEGESDDEDDKKKGAANGAARARGKNKKHK